MKDLQYLINENAKSKTQQAKDDAREILLYFCKQNDFDYDKTLKSANAWKYGEEFYCRMEPADYFDRYDYTNSQENAFIKEFDKIINNKNEFIKFIKPEIDKKEHQKQRSKKLKDFLKVLDENELRVVVRDKNNSTNQTIYKFEILEDTGDICLTKII